MKKKLLVLTVPVTAIIMAGAIVTFHYFSSDEILNANVEALAGPGGDGVIVPCELTPEESCTFTVWAKDPEGKLVAAGIQTYQNMKNIKNEQN